MKSQSLRAKADEKIVSWVLNNSIQNVLFTIKLIENAAKIPIDHTWYFAGLLPTIL